MENQFISPEGNLLGQAFVNEAWIIERFSSDQLWVWGDNDDGQLGINDTTDRLTPVTTFAGGSNWKQVSAGNRCVGAVKSDGTLWVWGRNDYNMLGTNTNVLQAITPITTFAGGTDWKSITFGDFHAAAIKEDGTLWTWGYNNKGQLGVNDTTDRSTPVTTFAGGNDWKQSSCGHNVTSAIKTDGSLYLWGRNHKGQLGVNDGTNRHTPVTTFAGGTDWKQVSCGAFYATAIKTDGTLWTWGDNETRAPLGVNDEIDRSTPVTTFAGGNNWKSVHAGHLNTTSAIKTDGTLWMWGRGFLGKLGINLDDSNRSTPVTTFAGGNNWKTVYSGGGAIKTDGTLWTWGELCGVNDVTRRLTPVTTFAGGTNWKQISSSSDVYSSYAITTGPEFDILGSQGPVTVSETYTSNSTVTIPAGVLSVSYTIHGGKGGQGGNSTLLTGSPPTFNNNSGGLGARGQKISGVLTNVGGLTLSFVMGNPGSNGTGNYGQDTGGAGGSGRNSGGQGGTSGGAESHGTDASGGGGGGSTAILVSSTDVVIAGGGGGGGGAAANASSFYLAQPGTTSNVINTTLNRSNGGGPGSPANTTNAGNGGGGAGSPGGTGGGGVMSGNHIGGYGGVGGQGYYNTTYHTSAPNVVIPSDSDTSYIEISYVTFN